MKKIQIPRDKVKGSDETGMYIILDQDLYDSLIDYKIQYLELESGLIVGYRPYIPGEYYSSYFYEPCYILCADDESETFLRMIL